MNQNMPCWKLLKEQLTHQCLPWHRPKSINASIQCIDIIEVETTKGTRLRFIDLTKCWHPATALTDDQSL